MSQPSNKSCPQQLLGNLLAGSSSAAGQLTKGGDQDGLTPLHLAARYGSIEAVGTILDAALASAEGSSAELEMGMTLGMAYRQVLECLLTRLSKSEREDGRLRRGA